MKRRSWSVSSSAVALDDRVQRAAVLARGDGLPAAAALDRRLLAGLQVRAARGLAARQRDRRVEHLAGRVGVDQVRAELLAEPQVALAVALRSPRCRSRRRSAGGRFVVWLTISNGILLVRVAQAQEAVDLDLVRSTSWARSCRRAAGSRASCPWCRSRCRASRGSDCRPRAARRRSRGSAGRGTAGRRRCWRRRRCCRSSGPAGTAVARVQRAALEDRLVVELDGEAVDAGRLRRREVVVADQRELVAVERHALDVVDQRRVLDDVEQQALVDERAAVGERGDVG